MQIEQEIIRYDHMRHINAYVSKIRFQREHMHSSFEVCYVLSGHGVYHQGDVTRTISQGDLILMNPYMLHSFAALEVDELILLTVQIHRLFVRRYIDGVPKLLFCCDQIAGISQEQHAVIVKLLVQTALAYCEFSFIRQFELLGSAALLMGKLVSFIEWKVEENPDSVDDDAQKRRAQRIISYIDENYRQKITLSTLAEREGISTTYLSHFFRKTFGVTFQMYLNAQRLEKALMLLRDRSFSLVDICMSCGFSDGRYLEAACRKTFGCSVAECRKRLRAFEELRDEEDLDALYIRCDKKESLELMRKHLSPDYLTAVL